MPDGGEHLYDLLPVFHRIRDAEAGHPLRALLAVMQSEVDRMETDIERLHENWFIETCEEWLVPYVGDLLAVRGVDPIDDGSFSLRAFVANTLEYRQAKGTAFVLERVARDLTGWPAVAVEFFERLAGSQHLNHVRPHAVATARVRDANALELLGTAFDLAPRTVDVRRIARRRGTHNVPNVGLYVWRFPAYSVTWGEARRDTVAGTGRFTCDPVGRSQPLFNRPRSAADPGTRTDEAGVPGRLRRRALHDELRTLRTAVAEGTTHEGPYFGPAPVLQVRVFGEDPVPPEQLVVCNLKDWELPAASTHERAGGGTYRTRVVVDPHLGRLGFLDGEAPARVEVSYTYAFGGDLGAGPYDRSVRDAGRLPAPVDVTWQRGVLASPDPADPDAADLRTHLDEAIADWNAHVASLDPEDPDPVGIIALMDSATYRPSAGSAFEVVEIPERGSLYIVAADWPLLSPGGDEDPGVRFPGRIVPVGRRPHLQGRVIVRGTAPDGSPQPGRLVLEGLIIEGDVIVADSLLGGLDVLNSTIAQSATLSVEGVHARLELTLDRMVCGQVIAPDAVMEMHLSDCLVDGRPGSAVSAPNAVLDVRAVTFMGEVEAKSIEAIDSIFGDPLSVERRQAGCLQFSWIAPGSSAPRRFRCVPASEAEADAPAPIFTSLDPDDSGYGSLAAATDPVISRGASDGGEMGAFHFVHATRRLRNVARSFDEYLRLGLEAGIFTVT